MRDKFRELMKYANTHRTNDAISSISDYDLMIIVEAPSCKALHIFTESIIIAHANLEEEWLDPSWSKSIFRSYMEQACKILGLKYIYEDSYIQAIYEFFASYKEETCVYDLWDLCKLYKN